MQYLLLIYENEQRFSKGEDIKTVEFGWPVGMPVCRSLGGGIYEVRSDLARNRISRVLFYFDKVGRMALLHGFIKKTQKMPRKIWNWHGETRRRMRGHNESKEKERRNRSHCFDL